MEKPQKFQEQSQSQPGREHKMIPEPEVIRKGYRGSGRLNYNLVDYASTKGAIVSFTRSLSKMLAARQIRVNGVAPGPIWTPLIPATFDDISDFGQDTDG